MTPLFVALALAASPMEEGMHGYFAGETRESFAFGGLGLLGIGAAVPLFLTHDPTLRPMSIPLFAVGLLQLVLGIGLFARTPGQVAALTGQLLTDPEAYATAERARMKRVMSGFSVYRVAELLLAFGGAFAAGYGWIKDQPAALGAGGGLAIEAVAMLVLDHFAEDRGSRYAALLDDFKW